MKNKAIICHTWVRGILWVDTFNYDHPSIPGPGGVTDCINAYLCHTPEELEKISSSYNQVLRTEKRGARECLTGLEYTLEMAREDFQAAHKSFIYPVNGPE